MEKGTVIFIIAVIVVALIGGVVWLKTMAQQTTSNTENTTGNGTTKVLLETNYGNITIELRSDMPITTGNFIGLVNKGTYNGVSFHRIIPKFMIQGGDPTGTGYGDRSIPMIKDEFNGEQKNNRGTLAMANAGPNTGSSQFFINLVDNNFLDNRHPVFGEVISGMDVVDKMAAVQTDGNDKPLNPVRISKASVL
jgi:peptidylprolyl isomerase